jgi:hypothetical protein
MAPLLAVFVAGCGSNGSGNVPGTLGVSLTDAPACGFDAVNVTVVKVRVHKSSAASDADAGWTDITLNPARKINLLSLNNGVLDKLGETPLAAGHYTQVRLVLDPNTGGAFNNSVVPTGGVETSLVTPSAVQSGIKLVNSFDVASGERVDLLLDFDACKSIVKRGNASYALKPVIKIIPFALNGINGFVPTALLPSNVMVTAQQNGEVVRSTAPNAANGEFFLARLAPGNYDVVLTADGHATKVISAVPIASATSVVNVSVSGAPISLPVSATSHTVNGTAILNPPNATEVAYVSAKQSFGAALIATVRSVYADDLASGAYTLTLPAAAPLLGAYATPLPIVFSEQAGVAGHYTIEASANGYQTQSFSKDISAADATQDFILIP